MFVFNFQLVLLDIHRKLHNISGSTSSSLLESVPIRSVVLANLEYVGVAFGLSLLSSVEADYCICTSGNGGHL